MPCDNQTPSLVKMCARWKLPLPASACALPQPAARSFCEHSTELQHSATVAVITRGYTRDYHFLCMASLFWGVKAISHLSLRFQLTPSGGAAKNTVSDAAMSGEPLANHGSDVFVLVPATTLPLQHQSTSMGNARLPLTPFHGLNAIVIGPVPLDLPSSSRRRRPFEPTKDQPTLAYDANSGSPIWAGRRH